MPNIVLLVVLRRKKLSKRNVERRKERAYGGKRAEVVLEFTFSFIHRKTETAFIESAGRQTHKYRLLLNRSENKTQVARI